MNLNIDTDKPGDLALLKALLPVIFPAAAPAAAILVPNTAAPVASPAIATLPGFPALPPGAPKGATWVHSFGAPALQDAAGNPIFVDWTPTGPVIVPPPAPKFDPAAEAAGQALLKSIEG